MLQVAIQRGFKQRLGYKSFDLHIPGFFLNFTPVIGRNEKNRNRFADPFPDPADGLQPVHIGHLPVNQYKPVILFPVMALFNHLNCFFAVQSPFCVDTKLLQIGHRTVAEHFIIIHYQNIPFRKLPLLHRFRFPEIQYHMETASLPEFALQFNGSAHQLHDPLGNRHSKTGPCGFLHLLRAVSGKGIPNFFLELLGHSDSVVLHLKMSADIFLPLIRRLLVNMYVDPASLLGKFQRIREKV